MLQQGQGWVMLPSHNQGGALPPDPLAARLLLHPKQALLPRGLGALPGHPAVLLQWLLPSCFAAAGRAGTHRRPLRTQTFHPFQHSSCQQQRLVWLLVATLPLLFTQQTFPAG